MADALVAVLAEDQRLAVFELDDVLAARFFFGEVEPGAVIEDVAVLQDFDVGRALVRGGFLQSVLQVLLEDVHRAGHEGGFRADGQRQRIERARVGAERSGLGLLAEFGSRRILALGEAVDAVIEHQHLDAHVAAQHVNGVIAADGKRVAVAGGDPDFEFGMRELDSRGHGRRAPVNGVKAEGVHVIGEAAGAADSGNHHELFARDAQLGENGLHGGKNGVVAAARAPANFLVGLKILLGQNGHCVSVVIRFWLPCPASFERDSAQYFLDLGFELGHLERLALNLVVAFRVHQILGAQHHARAGPCSSPGPAPCGSASRISPRLLRQGIEIPQMHVADAVALGALRLQRGGDRAVGRAPGDDQQIAVGIARGNHIGNVLRDGFDFGRAQAHHFFVVQRFVVHVAGDVLLFQAADAMLKAGRAGNGPGARESLGIALVGHESPRDW